MEVTMDYNEDYNENIFPETAFFPDWEEPPAEPEFPEPEPPKICTLVLADGTAIENLRRNGNNYVSAEQIDESVFQGNISSLTITDNDGETITLRNAELIQQVHYDDGWYLCFREKTPQELALAEFAQWQQERQTPDIPLPLRPGITPADGASNSYRRGMDNLVIVSAAVTAPNTEQLCIASLPEGCRPGAIVQAGDITIHPDGSVWAKGSMAGTACFCAAGI